MRIGLSLLLVGVNDLIRKLQKTVRREFVLGRKENAGSRVMK